MPIPIPYFQYEPEPDSEQEEESEEEEEESNDDEGSFDGQDATHGKRKATDEHRASRKRQRRNGDVRHMAHIGH